MAAVTVRVGLLAGLLAVILAGPAPADEAAHAGGYSGVLLQQGRPLLDSDANTAQIADDAARVRVQFHWDRAAEPPASAGAMPIPENPPGLQSAPER